MICRAVVTHSYVSNDVQRVSNRKTSSLSFIPCCHVFFSVTDPCPPHVTRSLLVPCHVDAYLVDNGTTSRRQKFNLAFLDCDDLSLNASFFSLSPVLVLFLPDPRPVKKLRNCDVFPVLVLRVSLSFCQHAPRHPASTQLCTCLQTSRVGTRNASTSEFLFSCTGSGALIQQLSAR